MATARKLPSGNYRVKAYIGKENGKKKYKSITARTKKEAEFLALQVQKSIQNVEKGDISLSNAIDLYIDMRKNVLSPATIEGYRKIQRNYYSSIMDKSISKITETDMIKEVNTMSSSLSSKTVRNAYFFIYSVIKSILPDFSISVKLPQRQESVIQILSIKEFMSLCNYVKDTDMEIPVLFFGLLGLRLSELLALTPKDIDTELHTVTINKALVRGVNGYYLKQPKSESGSRRIVLPDVCLDAVKKIDPNSDKITSLSGSMIEKKLTKICDELKITHTSPHKLRHFHDSFLHAIGVTTFYGMQRMGHATEHMYNRVYTHSIPEQQKAEEDKINASVSRLFSKVDSTKDSTKI